MYKTALMFDFAEKVPDREINTAIEWLNKVIIDAEYRITKLEQLRKARDRNARYQKNLKNLAAECASDEFIDHAPQNQIEVIRQRLGCDYDRAQKLLPIVLRLSRKIRRENRDLQILDLAKKNVNPSQIAKRLSVSRPTVYKVINS